MNSSSATDTKQVPRSKTPRSFSIAEAKAHFSEVVSVVEMHRQPITILRRGRAVATLVPVEAHQPTLYGSMRGTVIELGDIVGPTGGDWSVGGE